MTCLLFSKKQKVNNEKKNCLANFLNCKDKQLFAFEQIVLKTNSNMYIVLFSNFHFRLP